MAFYHVFGRIFIKMIVQCFSPIFGMLSSQQRQQRYPLDIIRNRSTCQLKKSRCIINILYHFRYITFPVESLRQTHYKRSTHRFLIHKAFIKPTMFAHIKSLIGSINHQRIVQHSLFFQIVKYTPYIIIQRFHCLHIVTHIPLKLPVGQFFSF